MAGNFPNLVKETDILVQEAYRVPKKMNPKRPTPRHSIIKMPKVKSTGLLKNSKVGNRNKLTYLSLKWVTTILKKNRKERIPVTFNYRTFTPRSEDKRTKELQRKLKSDLIGLLSVVVWAW